MIGLNITEKEYRELSDLSYSLLSSVSRLRHAALRERDDWSDGIAFGKIVEDKLFDDYDEEEYHLYNEIFSSETKLKKACDMIFSYLIDERKISRGKLVDYILDIQKFIQNNEVDYYESKEPGWVASKIVADKDANKYWEECLAARGKIIVTQEFLELAERAVETLRTHQFTGSIFETNGFGNIEKNSQVKLTFNYAGYDFKCMLDWLVIDHDEKKIKPYDLKTGAGHVEEFEKSFFYWRYDIQACLYTIACYALRDTYGLSDYDVDDFKFVYIGRKNVDRPLVFVSTDKMRKAAFHGYIRDGYEYKGIKDLIKDYLWYKEDEGRLYPKEVYDASGEVIINDNVIVNNEATTKKDSHYQK